MPIGVVSGEVNNGLIIGVPKNIHTNLSLIGNVGIGLDDLHSFSLPATYLFNNNDYLRVRYGGSFADNANLKRIVVSFAGQNIHDSGLFDIRFGATWSYDIVYQRVSTTVIRANMQLMWFFINLNAVGTLGGNGSMVGVCVDLTVANLMSNDSIIKLQAEGTADNDILQKQSIIELIRTI